MVVKRSDRSDKQRGDNGIKDDAEGVVVNAKATSAEDIEIECKLTL